MQQESSKDAANSGLGEGRNKNQACVYKLDKSSRNHQSVASGDAET